MKLFLSCPEEASDEKEWLNLSPFYTLASTSVMLIKTPDEKFYNEQPHPEHLSLGRVPLLALSKVFPLVTQIRVLEEGKYMDTEFSSQFYTFRWR